MYERLAFGSSSSSPLLLLTRKQPLLRVLAGQRDAKVSSPVHLARAFISATLPGVIYIYGLNHKYKLPLPDLAIMETRVVKLLLSIDGQSVAPP